MSELYEQILNDRSSLERLVARIPGFSGYVERSARRESDRILRTYIAKQMGLRIKRFAMLEKRLLDAGGLSLMSDTRSIKSCMQIFHDKINTVAPKHSNFFERIKIQADDLERIYRFDEAQLQYIEQFDPALEVLEVAIQSASGIAEALKQISSLCDEADKAFSKRENVIIQLSASN